MNLGFEIGYRVRLKNRMTVMVKVRVWFRVFQFLSIIDWTLWKQRWQAEGGLGWGQNLRGSGGGSPTVGSRSRGPVGGLGDEVPRSWRIVKVVTSKFYAFLVVYHTFSVIYAYVFFRACRHHSTQSAKWGGGAFDTVCPLVCKLGATAPPTAAPLPMCGRRDYRNC